MFPFSAWSTEALLAVAGVAILAGAIVELDTINMTALQRTTASIRLGSTLGLLHTLAAAWIMAGAIVAGALVNLLGVGAAMVICASIVVVLGAAFGLASLLHPPMAVASAPTARAVVTRTANVAPVFDPALLTSLPCSWAIDPTLRPRPTPGPRVT